MDEIYVKTLGIRCLEKRFPNVDIVSVEDLISEIEDLQDEVEELELKAREREADIEDNYRRIPASEQYGINESDFI